MPLSFRLPIQQFSLTGVPLAWTAQASSPGSKIVVQP